MKYYLVALFDKDSNLNLERMQRNICRKYKLYKSVRIPHIIIETLEDPNIDKFHKVVSDILKPYKKFKVEVNSDLTFNSSLKMVNIKVENKGYIIRIARQIDETLKLYKFNVRENTGDYDLYIPVAKANFGIREWNAKEYVAACESVKRSELNDTIKISKMELWKAVSNRRDMVVSTFELRNF